jgi:hypothetical protein
MEITKFSEWVTLIGAVVAAVAGIWNLTLSLRGKTDEFRVGLGSATPEATPEMMLHVISLSDHPITIADYGFIEDKSETNKEEVFFSFRMAFDLDPSLGMENVTYRGTVHLKKRGDPFEAGMMFSPKVIGAFARTMTQKRPKLTFDPNVSWWRSLKLRYRVWRRGMYGV